MAGYDFDILRALGAISLVVAIDCPGFQTERELIFGDNCAFWQEQPHPDYSLSLMRGSASVSTINIWRRCNGQGQYTFWLVFQICLVASVSTINIWRRCSGLANLSALVFLMLEMVENICRVRDNWHHCSFGQFLGKLPEFWIWDDVHKLSASPLFNHGNSPRQFYQHFDIGLELKSK